VQTTLLGIAIALILALVAALVGPFVVDWQRFRPAIEAEASRLIGAPVRVTGSIEAAILPSPSLTLRGLEIGPSHAVSSVRVRSLGVELSLGSLVRGQWRAAELHLVGPDFNLGIDSTGQLVLPPVAPGFDSSRLTIDRLNIEDGHAVLADSRSGSRLTLDKLWFNGDVRSLAGPLKGDGAFVIAGDLYAYRIAASKVEDGEVKLRFNIDPLDRPLAVEAEGALSFAGAAPRFEGSLNIARPAGMALPDGRTFASDPWRLTSKVKATSASALFEQIEFQYGPEERALKLNGTAELKFGDKPRFDGVLSAAQIDLDRAFASPDSSRQLPLAALKTLGQRLSGALRPSIPARLGVSVDMLTLAGSNIQTLRGDVTTAGDGWKLDGFELRAPGFTQVNLSGRLDLAPGRVGFSGPVSVDSTDPTTLVAWLEGNNAQAATRMKPFRARGDVTLGSEKIAFDRLSAEIDRKWVEGRFAYAWAAAGRPARLEADLNAAELDVDALLTFANAARGATTFEPPREVTLGLGIGRAVVAGVEAEHINARLWRDAAGLHIERFSIGNFGGMAFDASGQIDTTASPPRGALNVQLDARNFAGVVALAEKFAPDATPFVRRLAQRLPSAQLNATLALDPTGTAKFAVQGKSGDVRMSLRGETTRTGTDLQSLAAAEVRLEAKFNSDRGGAIVELLNLGNIFTVDAKRGELTIAASGPLGGELNLDGHVQAGGLDASAKGTLRLRGDEPKADLRLALATADVRTLRRASAAKPTDPLTVSGNGNLAVTGHSLTLDDFSGTFAGTALRGRLGFDFAQTPRIEGQIEADAIDGAAAIAATIGMPGADARSWSGEPFAEGLADGVEGRIDFKAARASITPTLSLRQARGTMRVSRSEVAFTDLEGGMADGQAKGQLIFHKKDEGLVASGKIRLANADVAALLGSQAKPPVSGRVTLQLDVEGAGLSPQAVIGSLAGDGFVSITQGQFAALNAKVFETATREADRGSALDMAKMAGIATMALDSGTLAVPSAEGVMTIANGQVRLTNLATRAHGADLTVTGNVDLLEQTLNARLSLSGQKDTSAAERPVVFVFLSGPVGSPKRTVDVSGLTTWLTLRAVEHQSKQLEEIEERRRAAAAATAADEPPSTFTTPPAAQAPPLPPPIEIPTLPGVSEQKPARAPAQAQSATPRAKSVKPAAIAPMPLAPPGLAASPDN
jgi:large subunit ribosomal protein L24